MEENRNPLCIKGYLGRKWYFLINLLIAVMCLILQLIFCMDIIKASINASKITEAYSIFQLFAAVPKNVVILYLLITFSCWIVSFINDKKRFTDILGTENRTYLYSALMLIPNALVIFLKENSVIYWLTAIISIVLGLFLLFKPGKLVVPVEKTIVIQDNDEKIQAEMVVSFWRRWGAYIIDTSFIITPLTLFISYVIPKFLYSIGNYSILVGFLAYLIYFGLMNSRLTKGQTLGKMVCQIRVVDENNDYLSICKSFLRALIYTIALLLPTGIFLIIITSPKAFFTAPLISAFAILIFINIMFKALFVFNIKTRQTLHDLTCGSYVVTTKNNACLENTKINAAPVVSAIILAFLLSTMVYTLTINAPVYKNISQTIIIDGKEIPFQFFRSINTISVNEYDIHNKQRAETIGKSYLKSHKKLKHVNVILQRNINLGNTINKKMQAYKIEWQK